MGGGGRWLSHSFSLFLTLTLTFTLTFALALELAFALALALALALSSLSLSLSLSLSSSCSSAPRLGLRGGALALLGPAARALALAPRRRQRRRFSSATARFCSLCERRAAVLGISSAARPCRASFCMMDERPSRQTVECCGRRRQGTRTAPHPS